MANIPCIKVGNAIPRSSMPINRNFCTNNSRKLSFKDYKGNLNKKDLALKLGLFFVSDINKMFCFYCGFITYLNEDHTLKYHGVSHSEGCKYLPINALDPDDIILTTSKDNAATQTVPLKESKPGIDQDGTKPHYHVTMDNKEQCVMPKTKEEEKEVCENVTHIVPDCDSESEDEEISGIFWECRVCGEDRKCKIVNVPCFHRTYCAECTANVVDCNFCHKKVVCFWPVFT